MSESALQAYLLSLAVPYCRSRYGDGIRTISRGRDGRWGLCGDYFSLSEARGRCSDVLKRGDAQRAFAYGGCFGEAIQELDRASLSLVSFEPPALAGDRSPRCRQSALAC